MAQFAQPALSLFIILGYVVGASLAVYAVLPGSTGRRWGRLLIVPAIGAIAMVALLLLLFVAQLDALRNQLLTGFAVGQLHLSALTSWLLVIVAAVSAVVAVYLAAHALPHGVGRVWKWRNRSGAPIAVDVARGVLLAALVLGIVGSARAIEAIASAQPRPSAAAQVIGEFELAGSPTGMTLTDEGGYITTGEGQILRFELGADGSTFDSVVVADGLSFPRGPVVVDDRLLVVDLGTLACADPYPQCWTADPPAELERLNASSARVLSFPIADDGELGEPQTIVDGLPVVNTEHAPNSMQLGPDGYVYLPVGGLDRLPFAPELIDGIDHPNAQLLGTVVRFRPAEPEVEIYATGIRNIFDLVFTSRGRLLGVDNDGLAIRGWRHEQLIEIGEGADFGFPGQGTFGPDVPSPLWILTTAGSSGIEEASMGQTAGVMTGGLGTVRFVPLGEDDAGLFVANERSVADLMTDLSGFVTSIESIGNDRYALALLDPSASRNALLVIELSEVES